MHGILLVYEKNYLMLASTWMNLKTMMLSERSQTQQLHIVIPFAQNFQKKKNDRDRNDRDRWELGLAANEHERNFWQTEIS